MRPSARSGSGCGAAGSCTVSMAFSSSTSRSEAPAARCSSPKISDSAATAPATITA